MMNGARIAVGVQGLAVASTAYLNALAYARERQQGSSVRHFKDPNAPRVPDHRALRRPPHAARDEGQGRGHARAGDQARAARRPRARAGRRATPAQAAYHQGQVDLLTPIVKAYCSDQAFRIAELAIQTYGGAGFVEDHPVEQYCRDAKIFSIYEGTNHIQAARPRRPQAAGARRRELRGLPRGDRRLRRPSTPPGPASAPRCARSARPPRALQRGAGALMEYFMGGKLDQVTLVANAVPRGAWPR